MLIKSSYSTHHRPQYKAITINISLLSVLATRNDFRRHPHGCTNQRHLFRAVDNATHTEVNDLDVELIVDQKVLSLNVPIK